MPLRQIARTPKRPYPRIWGIEDPYAVIAAYAYAIEIRKAAVDTSADMVVVRCPWCGQEHITAEVDEDQCPETYRLFAVAIPAGTPVLA